MPEALAGPWRLEVETVIVVQYDPAVLIDEPCLRIGEDHGRLSIQDLHAARQGLWGGQVVGRRPAEVLATRQLERAAKVAHDAQVPGVARVADPRVLGGVVTTNLAGAIRRGVVADRELEVLEGLSKQRVQGFGEVALAVVHDHPDAHSWRGAGHELPR